jgi:hypothetical protein
MADQALYMRTYGLGPRQTIQWYPSTSYICIYNDLPQAPGLPPHVESTLCNLFYFPYLTNNKSTKIEQVYKDMTLLSAGLVVSGT